MAQNFLLSFLFGNCLWVLQGKNETQFLISHKTSDE